MGVARGERSERGGRRGSQAHSSATIIKLPRRPSRSWTGPAVEAQVYPGLLELGCSTRLVQCQHLSDFFSPVSPVSTSEGGGSMGLQEKPHAWRAQSELFFRLLLKKIPCPRHTKQHTPIFFWGVGAFLAWEGPSNYEFKYESSVPANSWFIGMSALRGDPSSHCNACRFVLAGKPCKNLPSFILPSFVSKHPCSITSLHPRPW
jgi:hypothetical protein